MSEGTQTQGTTPATGQSSAPAPAAGTPQGTPSPGPAPQAVQQTVPVSGQVPASEAPVQGKDIAAPTDVGDIPLPPPLAQWTQKFKLPPEAIKEGFQAAASLEVQQQALARHQMEIGTQQLMQSWGSDAKYNLQLAKQALKQVDGGGELSAILKQTGYAGHPAVIKFMYQVGRAMREGGFLKSTMQGIPGKKTAAQILYGDAHPSIPQ